MSDMRDKTAVAPADGGTARRAIRVALGLFLVALVFAAPARAVVVHRPAGSFGSLGSGLGQLDEPEGVAVNDSTELTARAAGDVYVFDTRNDRVDRFSATGQFLGWFDGSGTYEVEEKVEHGAAAPTGVFSFIWPGPIAVDDSTGAFDPSREDVYVSDAGHGVIDKFGPLGEYLGQIAEAKYLKGTRFVSSINEEKEEEKEVPIAESEACQGKFVPYPNQAFCRVAGLAVDGEGRLWVSVFAGQIYSFSNASVNVEESERITPSGGLQAGLAVDSENDFYASTGARQFSKFTEAGRSLATRFGGAGYMVTFDSSAREVYIDDGLAVEALGLGGAPVESEAAGALAPSFGGGLLRESWGLGANGSDGMVYVSDRAGGDVEMFEAVALPTVVLGSPSGRSTRGAVLNGTVNPEGRPVTSCVFEYDTRPYAQREAGHGRSVACSSAGLGSGKVAVPVSASLSGLSPQTTYYYRLVAGNSGGVSASSGGELFTGPRLGDEYVVGVGSDAVSLRSSLDPDGAETSYFVEYGLSGAYGSTVPVGAPPGVAVGSGVMAQGLSVPLQGLTPGTVYHYRFVSVQDGESFTGPDRVFVTQSASIDGALPDGRAWQLVSPANKKGALLELAEQGGQVQAAADGGGIAYIAKGPALGEGAEGKATEAQDLSSRTPAGGWRTLDLTLPGRLPENESESALEISQFQFEYRLFSRDLSSALVEPQADGTPPLASGVSERTLYVRDDASGAFLALVTPSNVFPQGRNIEEPGHDVDFEMHVLAASPDLKSVVFRTPVALTPEAVQEETVAEHNPATLSIQWNVYEWHEGVLRLVNVLPSGVAAHGKPPAPPVRLAGMANVNGDGRGGGQRDVSVDGRWVAWAWGEPYFPVGLASYRGLFVRDMFEERTLRVGGAHAVYQTMSADGSRVFYLEGGDLYELDTGSGVSTDLTAAGHGAGESGEVQEAVSDVSEDGTYAYFVAKHALTANAVAGGYNLYVAHDNGEGSWSIALIATLSERDKPTWYAETYAVPFLARVSSRVSPDGRYLAFMSQRSLTGYDNTDVASGEPDEEVYEYDAESQRLACVSCDPTGARPQGVFDDSASELLADRNHVWNSRISTPSDVHWDHWLAGDVPGWDNLNNNPTTYQPRYLTDNGRVFFDSPVGLVARDTNGLEDVYEYEPRGVGGCTSATASATQTYVSETAGHPVEGCIGLLSSGTSSAETAFYDAGETGDDVFFATASKLVGEDYDAGYDVYDAHVCSAKVPCSERPVSPPPCASGDSCKGAPTPQPVIFGAPASATFQGIGNVLVKPSMSGARPVGRAQNRARALARALKACRHRWRGVRRKRCERRARRLLRVPGSKISTTMRKVAR